MIIKGAGNLPYLLAILLRLFIAFIILLQAFIISNKAKIVLPKGISFYGAILIEVLAKTIDAAYLWLHTSFHISIAVFKIIMATLPLFMYAIDMYLLKKTNRLFTF